MKQNIKTKFTTMIFKLYIELIYKTSSIEFIEITHDNSKDFNNCILGFYHGDSALNYLLFKYIKDRNLNIDAIVTGDSRGDFIEGICKEYNVNAIRAYDGLKMREAYKLIKETSIKENRTLAIALDGPLGPLHVPKKLSFSLSNSSNKDFALLNSTINRKITLSRRWDNYIIPLPFSKIKFHLEKRPPISSDELKNFNKFKENIKPLY